ncbi:hypothetical protein BDW62DRAFT_200159 [Aspergillus aurantiobrunneus]
MVPSSDQDWLAKCQADALPVPPFDRYVYILENHVVKTALRPGELGFDDYQPDTATVSQRDENELRTLEIVREYTDLPVPKLIHRGDGFNVFERIPGITIFDGHVRDAIPPRQQEWIKLQVQGYIKQLAKVPNGTGGIRSLGPSGEVIHNPLYNGALSIRQRIF